MTSSSTTPTPYLFRVLSIAILLAAFWLRVFDLNTLPPGLHTDEVRNFERDWRLVKGYGLPLLFDDDPEPFDPMARAVFLAFAGVMPFNARLFTVFLNVLAAAATMAAARALFRDHREREIIVLVSGLALAALPSLVIMGRGLYRTNWLPLMTMLAVAALAWGWRTGKRRYFIAAGVFTALSAIFYLSGLFFPIAAALILLVWRSTWPDWRNLLAMAAAGGATMLPWFYLYLRIPNWLTLRIDQAGQGRVDPLADPVGFLGHAWRAVRPIYEANTYFDPRYNTFTTPFLNPVLLVLFLVGLVACVWRWRKPGFLVPVIVGVVMLLPGALSGSPQEPVRLTGVFAPLALIAGLGAGTLMAMIKRFLPTLRRAAWAGVAALLVYSLTYTYGHVRYHYTEDPRTQEPASWQGFANYYAMGFRDVLTYASRHRQPVYLPIDYLNSMHAVTWLRAADFPTVRPYAGEALPAGEVILPATEVYGLPIARYVVQYGLLLPQSGEIVILPPLTVDDAETLRQQILDTGQPYINEAGWPLGHLLHVESDSSPFMSAQYRTFAPDESMGWFDGSLELVGADMRREMSPGEWIPVTLHWRLREPTGEDYFAYVQLWDSQDTSRGSQEDRFSGIFRHLYPTVMWAPGQIITETRWLHVYDDAPPGGYKLMVAAFVYPGPTLTGLTPAAGMIGKDGWLVAARPVISLPYFPEPPETAIPVDAQLAGSIRLTHVEFEPPLSSLHSGDTVTVKLYWKADAPPPDDYVLFLHIKDASGALLAQQDSVPFDGQYPTGNWGVGERVVTTHTLTLTGDGADSLWLGMYSWPSRDRVVVMQDGAPAPDRLVVVR